MSDSYRTPAELAELDEIVAEISRERAIAPGLATRYDAACERITELHEETTRQRSRIWDLEERLRNAEDHRSPRTSVDFLDEPVLPHRSPESVKTFREMLTEALDTAQAGDREGADHLLSEVNGHLGRRIAHLGGERDGVLALLRQVQTILDKWDVLHEVPHDHKCMYAVVEIQKLLNPREEDVEP